MFEKFCKSVLISTKFYNKKLLWNTTVYSQEAGLLRSNNKITKITITLFSTSAQNYSHGKCLLINRKDGSNNKMDRIAWKEAHSQSKQLLLKFDLFLIKQ